MYTHAYTHENACACMTPPTRWSTDTKTHNLCTNMHAHTHTHVYKRIHVQIHTHMHIYTCIMSAHIHTYTYIHTCIQNVHMNARKARRGSDCAGSPSWHQEALPFSLSASRQRAVQTTSAYQHWCGADPFNSLSTPAPRLSMAPRNEVIFLPFWQGLLRSSLKDHCLIQSEGSVAWSSRQVYMTQSHDSASANAFALSLSRASKYWIRLGCKKMRTHFSRTADGSAFAMYFWCKVIHISSLNGGGEYLAA